MYLQIKKKYIVSPSKTYKFQPLCKYIYTYICIYITKAYIYIHLKTRQIEGSLDVFVIGISCLSM